MQLPEQSLVHAGHSGEHTMDGPGLLYALPAAARHERLRCECPHGLILGFHRCAAGTERSLSSHSCPCWCEQCRDLCWLITPLHAALGGLLGGYVGDLAAKRYPHHGRIFACQFSVAVGIPFSLLILKVREPHDFALSVTDHVLRKAVRRACT